MIDEINYRCYRHQREKFPEVSPERWARIFDNAEAMEERFQQEFALRGNAPNRQTGNECNGGEGVKSVALPAQKLGVGSDSGRGCHDTHMRPTGECSASEPVLISDSQNFSTFIERIQTVCAEKGI